MVWPNRRWCQSFWTLKRHPFDTNLPYSSVGIYLRLGELLTKGFYASKSWRISGYRRHFEIYMERMSLRSAIKITVPRDKLTCWWQKTIFCRQKYTEIVACLFIILKVGKLYILEERLLQFMWKRCSALHRSMSRKFRPTSLGSQSGIYSVRGSELARTGKTSSNQIRCVVELLDDSEFFIDIDVS